MPPRARAHVQHALLAAQGQRVAHRRHHARLGDRLPAADRQRPVLPGPRAQLGRHEAVARDGCDRRQHPPARAVRAQLVEQRVGLRDPHARMMPGAGPWEERRPAASNDGSPMKRTVPTPHAPPLTRRRATRPCRPTSRPASTSSRAPRRTSRSTSSTTWTRSPSRPPRSSRAARTPRARPSCASRRRSASRASPSCRARRARSTAAATPPAASDGRARRRPSRSSRSTRTSSRPRSPPTTSTSRRPRARSRAATSRPPSTRSRPPSAS